STKQCPECITVPAPTNLVVCPCKMSDDPVDYASGLEVLETADLQFGNARGSLSLIRSYRTLNANQGAFGIGSGHNYSYYLDSISPQTANLINLFFPNGSSLPFTRSTGSQLVNNNVPTLAGTVMTTNPDSTTDLRWKDGTVYHFVAKVAPGRSGSFLTSITDPNGNATTITLGTGNPVAIAQVADSIGRTLKFSYDSSNRITSVVDPIGRTLYYTYNGQGTLASVTDPEGGITQYEYDGQNRVTKITDARKIVTVQNVYDANGRVIQQTQADGGITSIA